jgi:hypothetical protein
MSETTLTESQVCTQIITGGISCLPACSGGLITAHIFHLAGKIEVIVRPGGGGSHPMAPGEIGNLYQPVDHPGYVRPEYPDIFREKNHVTLRITIGETTTEKEYIVSAKRAKTIVRVANFMNMTEERMRVAAQNIQRISKNIVKALNFRKKR